MADDLIGALTSRVRELSLRVATLESELDAAQRRVRVYEEFDQTVQDALASALRSAFDIRERAEHTASAIVDDARAQRTALLDELAQLRAEREGVQREVAEARLARDAVQRAPAAAPPVPDPPVSMSEMRLAASEALRGVFKELVEEIRNAPPAPRPAAAPTPRVVDPVPPPPAPRVEPPVRVEPPPAPRFEPPARLEPPPAPRAEPPRFDSPPAPRLEPPEPTPMPRFEPPLRAEPPPAPRFEPPAGVALPPLRPAPRSDVVTPPPAVEDEEAPVGSLASEPTSEVQLVLSPIPSFPRLVEIERRIQSLPAVRTLYVRDFRRGVATLAVGLRQPLASAEFAAALSRLEHPRLRVVSSTRNVLELRIDGESAIA